ncbi:MAG: hypothetical protein AAB875_06145, partial [Patescibacteria group bacterium]
MDVTTVSMTEEDAEQKYQEYLEVVKTRREKYLEDLKKVYYALKKGKSVLDIYSAFKKTGVTENGDPKLAIALADAKEIRFEKETGGAGWFRPSANWGERAADVRLPADTFPEWPLEVVNENYRRITRREIFAKVPLIPAHLLPEGSLDNYYILWEVESWADESDIPAVARDPF